MYQKARTTISGEGKTDDSMKRKSLIAAFVLLLVVFLAASGSVASAAAGDLEGRQLTLMIYMCGSNLESQYGSASADIMEMLNAGNDSWSWRAGLTWKNVPAGSSLTRP